MRLPDPIANTTTEAYLAYKAGVLNIGDLKPSLYDPYLHYDAWLAYWAGLVDTYPIHDVGKNLYNKATATSTGYYHQNISNEMPVEPGLTYTFNVTEARNYAAAYLYDSNGARTRTIGNAATTHTVSFRAASNEVKVVLEFYAELNVDVSTYDFTGVQFELGSTATPYEPYTGTPECLTDEEALVAYLSGVTNTYPEEYSDPIDARITGYLRYLVSARFGRPDYPVNNIEFYLSLMKPPIVTNDTPSSNIELDNTAWAELIDVKMYGDTFQQTYSGKNLANYIPDTTLSSGVSLSVDNNGVYTLSGTCTANSSFPVELPTTLAIGTSRTMSFNIISGTQSDGEVRYRIRNSDGVYSGVPDIAEIVIYSSSTGTLSKTITNELKTINIWVKSGTVFSNYRFTLQLEEGSTATAYEPYVGGVPAPNPDNPQAVQTVTGEQIVKVQGKNLIQEAFADAYMLTGGSTSVGVYVTNNHDGTVSLSGKSTGSGTLRLNDEDGARLHLKAGMTYTLSNNSAMPSNTRMVLRSTNSTSAIISLTAGETSKSATIANDIEAFVFIGVTAANVETDGIVLCPQLEKGSTATTFEPYQSQEYEVNLGKNLYDKNSGHILNAYINLSDNVLTASSYNRTVYIPCLPNTVYTISTMGSNWTREYAWSKEEPAVGVTVYGRQSIGPNADHATIYTGPDARYIVYRIWQQFNSSETLEEALCALQVEVGPTATSYAPYFTPIELCKIGDYQDYIYKSDEKWYVHKECGSSTRNVLIAGIASDNTSDAAKVSAEGAFILFMADWGNDYATTAGQARISSNIGTYKFDANVTANYGAREMESGTFCQRQGTNDRIYFRNTGYVGKTGDEVRAILLANSSGTNLWWHLAAPTDTEITNAALVAQLDALAAAKSYNDKTYITVEATDPNLPALLKVEAGEYR